MNREQLIEAARLAYVSQWEAENIRVGNTGNHNRSRAGITAAADVLLAAHQAELAAAWSEGHAHGSAYADDPISFQDNPYAENEGDAT